LGKASAKTQQGLSWNSFGPFLLKILLETLGSKRIAGQRVEPNGCAKVFDRQHVFGKGKCQNPAKCHEHSFGAFLLKILLETQDSKLSKCIAGQRVKPNGCTKVCGNLHWFGQGKGQNPTASKRFWLLSVFAT
jgi:hypothetical protein